MIELKDGDTVKLGDKRYLVIDEQLVETPKGLAGDLVQFEKLKQGQEFFLRLRKTTDDTAVYEGLLGRRHFSIPNHAWCEINVPEVKHQEECRPLHELALKNGDIFLIEVKRLSINAVDSVYAFVCSSGEATRLSPASIPDDVRARFVCSDLDDAGVPT